PSIAVIPAPVWARGDVASSKPDKSFHALNDGHGPVQRTGPCFAGYPGLVARERRRAWEARGVTLHQPAAVGSARAVRSIVFGLFLTMKGGYARRSRRGRRRHHPGSLAWATWRQVGAGCTHGPPAMALSCGCAFAARPPRC